VVSLSAAQRSAAESLDARVMTCKQRSGAGKLNNTLDEAQRLSHTGSFVEGSQRDIVCRRNYQILESIERLTND